jgi:hypothetical protein
MTRTKDLIDLVTWVVFGKPMNFYFLEKDGVSKSYTLDEKVVNAVPIGDVRETKLELTDGETRYGIRDAMTRARFNERGFNANAVYIRKKNGTVHYDGGDVAQYQPLRIEHE